MSQSHLHNKLTNNSDNETKAGLPLSVREYKFPEFEVPQDDTIPVAHLDGFGYLFEEFFCFGLPEPLARPHIGMEVTMGSRKDQVQVAVSH